MSFWLKPHETFTQKPIEKSGSSARETRFQQAAGCLWRKAHSKPGHVDLVSPAHILGLRMRRPGGPDRPYGAYSSPTAGRTTQTESCQQWRVLAIWQSPPCGREMSQRIPVVPRGGVNLIDRAQKTEDYQDNGHADSGEGSSNAEF